MLGVVALGVCQEPVAFLGGVGEEGHAQIRVERFHGVVEYRKRVVGQVVYAFLGAAALETEVGIHLVRLPCHDTCDAIAADVPKFVDGLVADALVGSGLGDGDEIVNGVGGGIGVLHGRFLWLCFGCVLGGEKIKKDDKIPFDSYQKAKKVYIGLIMWQSRRIQILSYLRFQI